MEVDAPRGTRPGCCHAISEVKRQTPIGLHKTLSVNIACCSSSVSDLSHRQVYLATNKSRTAYIKCGDNPPPAPPPENPTGKPHVTLSLTLTLRFVVLATCTCSRDDTIRDDKQVVNVQSNKKNWRTASLVYHMSCWLHGTVVERRSLTGELSLSCARPAADGWPLMWVYRRL